MAHSFITNKDRLLSDIITGILPKSDAVDILVGYFYFSGYIQLADKLADKHLRILVGLDIDTRISNRVREVEELVEWQRIRSKVREEYFNNLVRLINETDNTDTDETIRIFRQFQHKIYNGTLEIRKTEDPCHAKMYLFAYNSINNENGEQPGDVITGSSNLSYQGLQGRTEINVRFTDKGKYTEGKQIFDELWSNAIPIVDENTVDRWKEKVEGFCWIDVNSTYLKARIKANGVFDVLSMSLFTMTNLPDWYYVALINSEFISLYVDNFINNTSHFQINDARQLPIVIPQKKIFESLQKLVADCISLKRTAVIDEILMEEKQYELDRLVRLLYGVED